MVSSLHYMYTGVWQVHPGAAVICQAISHGIFWKAFTPLPSQLTPLQPFLCSPHFLVPFYIFCDWGSLLHCFPAKGYLFFGYSWWWYKVSDCAVIHCPPQTVCKYLVVLKDVVVTVMCRPLFPEYITSHNVLYSSFIALADRVCLW